MVKRLSSIAEVLASIPDSEDPFPHLAFLSTDDLLLRRREIQQSLKRLEEERRAIDSELVETFSDAELRFGIQFGGANLYYLNTKTPDTAKDLDEPNPLKTLEKRRGWDSNPRKVSLQTISSRSLSTTQPPLQARRTAGAARGLTSL